ncbi:response regulator [Cellulosilyticum sp. I15G10I2]|uniref:response regulator n=1 Tax=Cellulosilyticum sp. I15G10I2 TaxID=1892843 RepID=UPI00085CC706|nr:response regulator [Cellulosilyticum sp. I15G10I2]
MIILLADDERMVRLGLKSMLDELYPNNHTYIEAKNGKELINLALEHKPHIAFVDINMPLINGLLAIEACKCKTSLTQWLMLTGYSDFEYAKQAIKLGVSDYLLKPVSIQELSEVMQKTEKNLDLQLAKLNHSFALEVISAYNVSQVSDPLELHLSKCISSAPTCFKAYLFYTDNWDKNIRYQLLTKLSERLKQLFATMMDSDFRYALFYLNSGELCVVTSHCKNAIMLYAALTDFINESLDPITIFSSEFESLDAFCYECPKISEISHIRSIYKLGTIIDYKELLQHKDLDLMLQFAGALEKLCLSFIQGEELEYKNIIKCLHQNKDFHRLFQTVNSSNIAKYLNASIDLNLSAADYNSLLNELFEHRNDMYLNLPKKSNIDIISQIEAYIKENYMNEIGINSIAEMYDITPNYLSKIFHQKSGKKFINYLTEVRITNAKRIFSETPEANIKDISIRVGYYSTRHFTKMFSKTVGCLPSEYQKQILGKPLKIL